MMPALRILLIGSLLPKPGEPTLERSPGPIVTPPAEPFTVKTSDETWTRNTKTGACALADNLARRGRPCTVSYTESGEVFYEPDVAAIMAEHGE